MKIGLALSGGGARGLAHLKVLEAFDELNIKPDIIAGTSIGAFIGALYASGLSSIEIQKFFTGINFTRYAQLFDISFNGQGLVKGTKLENVFSKLIDNKKFEDLKIPLKIVATNLYSQKQEIFSKGSLVQAVRASISIPGVFDPVKINQKTYVDGGLTNLIPYDIIQKQCDVTIAIDVSHEKIDPKVKLNMINLLNSSFTIVQNKYAQLKLKNNPPNYYIKINLERYGLMDFQKHDEILKKSHKYKKKIKKILNKINNIEN